MARSRVASAGLGAGVEANIRKFRAFVTSARLGSFTRAAEELGCTQSTVSRMVASLEADWQLRLFLRRGTAPALTSDGQAVLEDADRLCRSYDELHRHVESLRGLDSGAVAIAAPSSIVALRLAGPTSKNTPMANTSRQSTQRTFWARSRA